MSAVMEIQAPHLGVFDGISNFDYHADKSSYSSTLVKNMKVPYIGKHNWDEGSEYKETYKIGSASHCHILEPEKFEENFLLAIKSGRSSGADKEKWCEWFEENGWESARNWIIRDKSKAETWNGQFHKITNKYVLTPTNLEAIEGMSAAIKRNSEALELLTGGKAEQSVYAIDPATGLHLKVRPDYLPDGFINDVKTIQDVDDRSIDRAITTLEYGIQDAMYTNVWQLATGESREFLFTFISKSKPHMARVIRLDDEVKETSYNEYIRRKYVLKRCLESGVWPAYENDYNRIPFSKQ